jgi:hypothetical protein
VRKQPTRARFGECFGLAKVVSIARQSGQLVDSGQTSSGASLYLDISKPALNDLFKQYESWRAQSKFVPQRELHHARLRKQAGVGSEMVWRLCK